MASGMIASAKKAVTTHVLPATLLTLDSDDQGATSSQPDVSVGEPASAGRLAEFVVLRLAPTCGHRRPSR